MAQALGVVHVIISGTSAEYRLPQQPDQSVAAIPAGPRIGEHVRGNCAGTEGVAEFAVGEQSGIGSDPWAMES